MIIFEKVSILIVDDDIFKSWKMIESKRIFEFLLEERKILMISKVGIISSKSQSKINRYMDRNLIGIPVVKDI